LFFTDPPYGLDGKQNSPDKQLPFNGVYRFSKDGQLHLLVRDLLYPNGIALSPDEKTLYVANSDPTRAVWMAYEMNPDGTVGKGRVFYDITAQTQPKRGLPNGLKVDQSGNIFATGPAGLYIFNPKGDLLGVILLKEWATNCAWGDDGSTLYITCNKSVFRIKTSTKGIGF
jgi:gluconolactonase